jgi:predicted nucleic acid-binding protein
MECPIEDDEAVHQRACRLTAELQHHLFDTLYHAVALERDALLLTADATYGRKAASLGHLCLLEDFEIPP